MLSCNVDDLRDGQRPGTARKRVADLHDAGSSAEFATEGEHIGAADTADGSEGAVEAGQIVFLRTPLDVGCPLGLKCLQCLQVPCTLLHHSQRSVMACDFSTFVNCGVS